MKPELNSYQLGAIKRKLGIKPGALQPGDMLSRMTEMKQRELSSKVTKQVLATKNQTRVAILGLI